MSAWKPSVFGRSTASSSSTMLLPAVHAAPADFAFGGQPFAVIFGDVAGFAERLGDRLRDCLRDLAPNRPDAAGRVDAHDAVRPDAEFAQLLRDAAAFANLVDELVRDPRRSPIAEPPPVGGQTGATTEPTTKPRAPDLVGQALQIVVGRVDADVRVEQEQVDAVELDAVHLGGGGEVEHGVEVDGRFRVRPFADEAGPHGVVKFRIGILHGCGLW